MHSCICLYVPSVVGSNYTRGSSLYFRKVTALGIDLIPYGTDLNQHSSPILLNEEKEGRDEKVKGGGRVKGVGEWFRKVLDLWLWVCCVAL